MLLWTFMVYFWVAQGFKPTALSMRLNCTKLTPSGEIWIARSAFYYWRIFIYHFFDVTCNLGKVCARRGDQRDYSPNKKRYFRSHYRLIIVSKFFCSHFINEFDHKLYLTVLLCRIYWKKVEQKGFSQDY